VGTAILSGGGVPVAAIAIAGVSARMPEKTQAKAGELLTQAVADLRFPER
jgi:DNA-binding IclR family transcriptional regulator